jgi:hypothetical protein
VRLAKIVFDNVMELEGSIVFPDSKAVVIHGENRAGKSNIIHALRYAFLSKVIRHGKSSAYDELRLVTAKEIAPSEGTGRILIEFSHGGKQFIIDRQIDRYRDDNKILRKDAEGFRELDFNKTLDKELKAGLLDALFAPDSAMGFKHLNEKNIDAVITELFKEIGNAKVLTKDFKQRTQRLIEEASARVLEIKRDYDSFVARLKGELKDVSLDLSNLSTYEFGKTSQKIGNIANGLKSYVDNIEKGEIKQWLVEMRKRALDVEDLEALLGKDKEIRTCFAKIKEISQDRNRLNRFMAALKETKLGGSMPPEPDNFYDAGLDQYTRAIYQKLEQAQNHHYNALNLAQQENIDLKTDNPAKIKNDKERVLRLLTREISLGNASRVKVDLVKIRSEEGEEIVHGLVPLRLMDKDIAFTRLSPEPIPDAPEEKKREYARVLERRIKNLQNICDDKDKAESFFDFEFIPQITRLGEYGTALMEGERKEEEKISELVEDTHRKLLLFTREHIEMPGLDHESDLEPFLLGVRQILSRKKLAYKEAVNQRVKLLNIEIAQFDTCEIDGLLRKLGQMEKDITRYQSIWEGLTGQTRTDWENKDAEYGDLTYVPAVAGGINKVLDAIMENAFDEQEVIQAIREIIIEINDEFVAEGLVNSCIEMSEGSLQLSKTTYKDREITHPCGAERSFFSLAVLTALAKYFGLPVIIDEAANNLDKNHLRHFISLVTRFAASYDVQYILSIKETDDFPLNGWVREFADDLQIYRVDYDGSKKYISSVDLYT